MSLTTKFLIAFLSAAAWAPIAFADSPKPGEYQTEGDWGWMKIKDGKFEISSIGGNAHICELSGKIEGNKGYTEDDSAAPEDRCVINLKPIPNGVEVIPETEDTCRQFCGMRAGFEGKYYLPPSDCTHEGRKAAHDEFQEKYTAKDYRRAYATLDAHFKRCSKFMNWVEIDNVRNDLAITQFHLGHKDACLKILQETRAAGATGEDDLGLPPADQDAYLPTAQATWFNMKKCGGQAKAK